MEEQKYIIFAESADGKKIQLQYTKEHILQIMKYAEYFDLQGFIDVIRIDIVSYNINSFKVSDDIKNLFS